MTTEDHSYELGIVGSHDCEHGDWQYFHSSLHEFDPYIDKDGKQVSAGTGIYATCGRCGLHRWNVTSPAGAEVVDLDTWEPEEDEEDEATP